MDIKLELLQNHISEYIRDLFEDFPAETTKLIDTDAVMALDMIKEIIKNENLSDFDTIENIVLVLEDYGIDCGGRHDF